MIMIVMGLVFRIFENANIVNIIHESNYTIINNNSVAVGYLNGYPGPGVAGSKVITYRYPSVPSMTGVVARAG